jgi:hypothetical protein
METLVLKKWEEFGDALAKVESLRQKIIATHEYNDPALFRGLGSSAWGLQTTLERSHIASSETEITDLYAYYRLALRAHAEIETFTDREWPGLPNPLKFLECMNNYKTLDATFFFINQTAIYRFLVYLRHHGYPSPLLDWTASPYVAAFFAFDGLVKDAEYVSIYAMVRDSSGSSSAWQPKLTLLGPFVRSHKRHMIQQSSYTVCMAWADDFRFRSHDDIFSREGGLGLAGDSIRIDIPASEGLKALSSLDLMNINPYSLFNTEDSLMQTLSRHAGLFKKL